jgi:hypothetical protein
VKQALASLLLLLLRVAWGLGRVAAQCVCSLLLGTADLLPHHI